MTYSSYGIVGTVEQKQDVETLGSLVKDAERGKLEPHEISLRHVILSWISSLEREDWENLDLASVFFSLASRLVQLKLRMLLPVLEDEEEEESIGLDLLELQATYLLGERLGELEAQEERFGLCRIAGPDEADAQEWYECVPLTALLAAAGELLVALEEMETLSFAGVVITHEEARSRVMVYLSGAGQRSLLKLLKNAETRLELVSYFLAVLELVRLGWCTMRARQGRISLRLTEGQTTDGL